VRWRAYHDPIRRGDGEEICANFDAALRREWLETNGLGGFASGTLNGCNTRRYHGLLVAATKPPVGRLVLLSKLEETLIIDGRRYELGTNRYTGAIHPHGFHYLKQFRLAPFPIFTFGVDGIEIEKTLFMVQRENATVINYRDKGKGATPDRISRLSQPDPRKRGAQQQNRTPAGADPKSVDPPAGSWLCASMHIRSIDE
jgi:hypothetical protein